MDLFLVSDSFIQYLIETTSYPIIINSIQFIHKEPNHNKNRGYSPIQANYNQGSSNYLKCLIIKEL